MLKYCQKSLNSSCFSNLESTFASIEQTNAANDKSLRIEEPLKSGVGNHIDIENTILKKEKLKANHEFITARVSIK